MNEIQRKRLEWLRDAKPGQPWDETIFPKASEWNWGPLVSEAAKAALDEIERLETIIKQLGGNSSP